MTGRSEGRSDIFWVGFAAGAAVAGIAVGLVASELARRTAVRIERAAREFAGRFNGSSGNGQSTSESAEAPLGDREHLS